MLKVLEIRYRYPESPRSVVAHIEMPGVDELVSSFYSPYHIASPNGDAKPPREISLSRSNGQFRLDGPSGEWYADGPGEAVAFYEAELTDILLRNAGDFIGLHGSAVVGGEGCLLLLGPSGAGKSTLTLGLCNAGMEMLADDALIVDPVSGAVRPFERSLRVHEKGLEKMCVRPDSLPDVLALEPYYWIAPDVLRNGAMEARIPSALVFLEACSETKLESLTSAETLRRLMVARLNEVRPKRDFAVLTRLSKQVHGYRLRLADFRVGLESLTELMRA